MCLMKLKTPYCGNHIHDETIWKLNHMIQSSVRFTQQVHFLLRQQALKSLYDARLFDCFSWSLVLVGLVDSLVNPPQEPANTSVNPRERGVTTAVTPRNDSCQHPVTPLPLTNQRTPAVTLAAVHTVVLRQAPGTQHAAGEAVSISFLTRQGWKQGDPGLEQSVWVLWVWQQTQKRRKAQSPDRDEAWIWKTLVDENTVDLFWWSLQYKASVYYCRLFVLQYKLPWGNYCCGLAPHK